MPRTRARQESAPGCIAAVSTSGRVRDPRDAKSREGVLFACPETPSPHTVPMNVPPDRRPFKGRGAASNPEGRFESIRHEAEDDGWSRELLDEEAPRPRTEVTEERARSVISRNDSPDIGFSQAINPYRGCEHGCIYCFARPSHSYLNLSPGLDFE